MNSRQRRHNRCSILPSISAPMNITQDDLAAHVELELLESRVPAADGPGRLEAGQPGQLESGQPPFARRSRT